MRIDTVKATDIEFEDMSKRLFVQITAQMSLLKCCRRVTSKPAVQAGHR